eukprot:4285928-Prorocentrum_lima.AAC.1
MTSSLVGSEMCIRDRLAPGMKAAMERCERMAKNSTQKAMVMKAPFSVSYTRLTLPTICSV